MEKEDIYSFDMHARICGSIDFFIDRKSKEEEQNTDAGTLILHKALTLNYPCSYKTLNRISLHKR